MKNVVGNWQISPIYTYQAGQWMSVQSGTDSNGNGDSAGDRAIFNPGGIANTGSAVTPLCNSGLPSGTKCVDSPANIVGYLAATPTAQYIAAGNNAPAPTGPKHLTNQPSQNWGLSFREN